MILRRIRPRQRLPPRRRLPARPRRIRGADGKDTRTPGGLETFWRHPAMIRLTFAALAAAALSAGTAYAQPEPPMPSPSADAADHPPAAQPAPTGMASDISAREAVLDGRRVTLLSSPTPADK